MINPNPLISICIPTYNGAQYIIKCIESALAQTYTNFEIIVNDDGSSDNTVIIVNEYSKKDKRIKVFQNTSNIGLVNNWNATLNLSSGEYIKWLFQDDWLEPNAIEEFVSAANKGYDFVISKRNFILADTATVNDKDYYYKLKKLENHFSKDELYHYFTKNEIAFFSTDYIALNFIAEPSLIFFRKRLLKTVGTYDKLFHQICDLEHNLRLAAQVGVYVINKPLCCFAVHLKSATSSNISEKYFQLRYTEQAYYAHKLLNDSSFNDLQKCFSFKQKLKLKIYYMFRIYELEKYISKQTDAAFYQNILNDYPVFRQGILFRKILKPLFFTIDIIKFLTKKSNNF